MGTSGGVCNIYEARGGFGRIQAYAEQQASAQEHGGACAWSVGVGRRLRAAGGECSTRHGEARPRARGFRALLLLSTAHHQTPAGGLGRTGPPAPGGARVGQSAVRGTSAKAPKPRAGVEPPARPRHIASSRQWCRMDGVCGGDDRYSVAEEQRQETRGWTAVGGGVDPPVRLLALSGAPGLRTVPRARPDVTSRQHTIRLVRAFQGLRGARGVSIWWTPHGCFSQQRRRRTAPGCATRPHIQSENARPSARLLIRQHVAPGTSSGGPPAPAPVPGPSRIAVRPARRSP